MKILIINKTIGYGSVGKIVEDLYSAIISTGNECKVAYAIKKDNSKIPDIDTIKIGSYIDRGVHVLQSLLFGKTAFYSKRATKKLISEIEIFKPDIVHIHGVYGYYVNIKILFDALTKMKIKLVSTLHSCWDFTGHCCYFDYVNCNAWQSDCFCCPQKGTYPKAYFDNTSYNYMMKRNLYYQLPMCVIVTPSVWLKKLVLKSFLSKFRIEVIYNGIDLSVFNHSLCYNEIVEKYRLSIKKPTILCVANRWEKRKGLDDILELAHIVENIQIIVVGLDYKQLKSIPQKIVGIKRTANMMELAMLYSFATVLFNPTYEDNYPTVNLEAIACKTPVITYDTGGCRETIRNGIFGRIIDRKDYHSLISYTNSIFNNEIVFDFSDLSFLKAQTMVTNYINLYRNIVYDTKH